MLGDGAPNAREVPIGSCEAVAASVRTDWREFSACEASATAEISLRLVVLISSSTAKESVGIVSEL